MHEESTADAKALGARSTPWIRALVFMSAAFAFGLATGSAGCSSDPGADSADGGDSDGGGSGGDGGGGDAAVWQEPNAVSCETVFRYVPPPGVVPSDVQATGEWNKFTKPGVQLVGPDASGAFTGSITLEPGLIGYKLVIDDQWTLDPGAPLRKYVGGVENSAVRVPDCHVPTVEHVSSETKAQGAFTARAEVFDSADRAGIDSASVRATLRHDFEERVLAGVQFNGRFIDVDVADLSPGKYALFIEAKDMRGHAAKPLRLVFWVESERFAWQDAVLYMVMTDRFVDGDPASNAAPTAGVDPRADFQGGDFEGVRQKIADGTLDQLGVRAIWLTPFQTNPAGSFPATSGPQTMAYHGYWPIRAREVDPRFGGEQQLRAMVKEAHAHGIRIVQDFVVNHIHEQHEYKTTHPDWFRTGCVCGTPGCDWTDKRLECLFSSYMPDVNWSVTEASEQFIDDAVFWLDEFDIDGLRVDAVKHVEDAAVFNMTARIRREFEAAGTRVFLTGETAMGWSDCGLACNQSQYDTITRYMGPFGLDGQFDFVLYHAVPYRVFFRDEKGLIHADYWARTSQTMYGAHASLMTPYIGSHDTARSITYASYRGQDPGHGLDIPGNQWTNIATAPPDSEPYARHRLALAWLFGLPGVPLLYYGDEYGQWGGADPNNRMMWRAEGGLGADETATLTFVRKLGQARKELVALRRGEYRSVYAAENQMVFARVVGANVALVAMNKSDQASTFEATLPPTIPLAEGILLKDRLSTRTTTVTGGRISVSLGARDAAVFAP